VKGPLLASLCATLLLGACGNDNDTNEGKRAADVVSKFALASGKDACKYLGGQALEDNYGGRSYTTGRAKCEKAAARFEGEAVTIKTVKLTSDTTARVDAESKNGRLYVVSLSKPEDDWVIERITQQRKQ
jgi:hypothetical protein